MVPLRWLGIASGFGGLRHEPAKGGTFCCSANWNNLDNCAKNSGSYGSGQTQITTTRGERMWQGQMVMTTERSQTATLWNSNGHWIGIFSGDKPITTWNPPLGFDLPLKIGKTWTKNVSVTNHAINQTTLMVWTQKVKAYEDVKFAIGTVKAFKISTSIDIGLEINDCYSPELGFFVKSIYMRAAKYPAGAGSQETELISVSIKK